MRQGRRGAEAMRTPDDREPRRAAGPLEVHRRLRRVAGVDRADQPHGWRPRSAERGRLVSLDQDGCVGLEGNGAHALIPKVYLDALVEAE